MTEFKEHNEKNQLQLGFGLGEMEGRSQLWVVVPVTETDNIRG